MAGRNVLVVCSAFLFFGGKSGDTELNVMRLDSELKLRVSVLALRVRLAAAAGLARGIACGRVKLWLVSYGLLFEGFDEKELTLDLMSE